MKSLLNDALLQTIEVAIRQFENGKYPERPMGMGLNTMSVTNKKPAEAGFLKTLRKLVTQPA